jgi:hypothetical protein
MASGEMDEAAFTAFLNPGLPEPRRVQRQQDLGIALVDRDNPHKEVRFAGDSPLEEGGFELPVPTLAKSRWVCLKGDARTISRTVILPLS